MSPMFRIFLVAILLLASCKVFAQDTPYNAALVSWENATELTDGSPIPASGGDSLATTRIIRSVCNSDGSYGTTVQTVEVPVPGGPLSVLFENLPDNTVQCFRARHFTVAGVQSDLTPTVSKAITPPAVPKKPRPPKNPKAN